MQALAAYEHDLYALGVIVGTFAAVGALLWLSRRSRWAGIIGSFRGIAQNFMSVISVLFALNLAFLGHDTWSAHDHALDLVFQEAGSLRTLLDLTASVPDACDCSALGSAVRNYAAAAADEWPLLAERRQSEAASTALTTLVSRIVTNEDVVLRSAMLQEAIKVRTARDQRIALSQTHVNPLKWMGMAFLGFLTMVSIAMVHVDQARAEFLAVLIFAAAAAPTAAIIMVHGNPFQEPAAVTPAPIADIVGYRVAE